MAKTLTKMFGEPYQDIKIKNNEYLKKSIIFIILFSSSIILISTPESIYSESIKIWLNLPSEVNLSLFFGILGIILVLVSILFIFLLAKLKPSQEEWTFYYLYKTVENLEKFLDNPKLNFLKKRASKNVRKTSSKIEYWGIGNLKFVLNQIGEPFDNFTNNFKNKIKSIIKNGSKEDIATLIPFFSQFLHFLKMDDPKIDDFLRVTSKFEKLTEKPPTRKHLELMIPYFEKAIGFINKYKIIKHIIHFGIIVVISYIVYFIGTCIEGVGIGNSYTAGIAVFVGFTVLKLIKMKK